ncbi:MAG TPA: serine/threonine-protein kinase [Pirellulaceae bacterium]|nr:serine/threonine-protein kinase [Pirellulaceae bacterium]
MKFLSQLGSLLSGNRVNLSERFQILSEAVNGTMSNFHRALDKKNNQTVGLKILDSEKTNAFESRFKLLKKPSEGDIGLLLKHPRIVETYEIGKLSDGRKFILMEYIEGTGLNSLIKMGSKSLDGNRLLLIQQMAEALDAVHKAGFIHRDICPRNFIVANDGQTLKLIDFGLTLPDEPAFRQPGNRTGTPLYLAPEIVRRKQTDQRVDIFAFGVTCYQLCTGDFPWPGTDVTGTGALSHDTSPPEPILKKMPKLNKALAKLIMQCIEADANNRPQTAEAIVKQLKAITSETE